MLGAVTLMLFLAFCPRILGGGEYLRMMVLLKKVMQLQRQDNHRFWDIEPLLDLKFKLYALSGVGDVKTSGTCKNSL